MTNAQTAAICIAIVLGLMLHGKMTEPPRYTFQRLDRGYVFDTRQGTLKVFPITFGDVGFVPYTEINTKDMSADTHYKVGESEKVKELLGKYNVE